MQINYTEEWAILLCRLGAFFMMVDGEVTIEETRFVKKFIEALSNDPDANVNVDTIVSEAMAGGLDFDNIIAETEKLLTDIDENAKSTVLLMLTTFISSIILADDIVTIEEHKAFREWKRHFKIAI